jgi:dihydroorotate dehydrogenase
MSGYERTLRPLLFRLNPEKAQALAEWGLGRRWLWRAAARHFDYQDPRLNVTVAGIKFPSPVGLAAGYDKDCEVLDSLLALGFGYVVGGTVLPEPRAGNPKPRVVRLAREQSLINALGFPSKGSAVVARNLELLRGRPNAAPKPVVVSLAGLTLEEFQACHAVLEPLADATELNISSPNTQGIRVFQEPDTFRTLLERINTKRIKPLFVKIPPYYDDPGRERVLSLVRIAREAGADGITAANTKPVDAPRLAMGQGGLSGRPLLEDMLRIVAEVRAEVGGGIVVNACGGIATAQDAFQALQAGADTVQLLTGLIYRGPGVSRAINRGLVQMIEAHGCGSLTELVASAAT